MQAMVCAIAELESDRRLLVMNYEGKSKEPKIGLMQLTQKTSEWLIRYWINVYLFHLATFPNSFYHFGSVKLTIAYSELGHASYLSEGSDILFRPFINVYLGAAYIKWLSNFENM